jgi:hypothetical protein
MTDMAIPTANGPVQAYVGCSQGKPNTRHERILSK